jgi:nucleoside-diphosphate-sugar epimerase
LAGDGPRSPSASGQERVERGIPRRQRLDADRCKRRWQWRPLVDVSDVARAHITCLTAPLDAVRGEIYNVMQENYQVRQLAMLVAGSLNLRGRHVTLEEAPLPKLVRDYRMSNLKMTQRLGFTPAVTVLESIDEMLANLPLDDVAWLMNPRCYNIAWMSVLEEVHAHQREFASIY